MFETRTLPNGVRVLQAPQADAQSTAAMVMYAAGSRYERPEASGIAHFCEHMFFKGTERRPTAKDIAFEVDAMGAEFNAFTGKEYTGYYIKCAKEQTVRGLDVLADMLLHSRFDGDEIEREKGVIVEELNMYLDTPSDHLPDVYDELLYGDTPLGRKIVGSKDTVRAATRDTFLEYIDEWYVPRRMVVGLGGSVTDAALAAVEQHFGGLGDRESGSYEPFTGNGASGPEVRLDVKDSDQLHIRIGGGGLPLGHPDRYVAQVLSALLGGGMSSRLFSEVRERRGLAYYVFAQHGQHLDTGSLFAQAGVDTSRAEEAMSTIVGELRRIADDPVPAEELDKTKSYLRGRLVLGLEDPRSVVAFGLRGEVLEGEARELPEILAGIDAVTAEDVQRLARELFAPEELRLATVGPFDDQDQARSLLATAS
jgi:predicted Zn-dependent peptidase